LREPLALQHLEENLRVTPRHVGVGLAFLRRVTEVAPTLDHLLRRPAADAELKPAARDQVGGARVFGHVQRVLVAHVDDDRADLDLRAPTAATEERRAELTEMAQGACDPGGDRDSIDCVGARPRTCSATTRQWRTMKQSSS
jgi:hypothetical protein